MASSKFELRALQNCRQALTSVIAACVLASCATADEKGDSPLTDSAATIDTGSCSASKIGDPAGLATDEEDTSRPICIVFNAAGCPVYTVFAGRLNGVPAISQSGVKKLTWQAVTIDEAGNYSNLELEKDAYAVVFDPFVNSAISSKKGGWAQSKRLCETSIPGQSCAIPGAEFKYTVWTPNRTACNPLDPVIRVNM